MASKYETLRHKALFFFVSFSFFFFLVFLSPSTSLDSEHLADFRYPSPIQASLLEEVLFSLDSVLRKKDRKHIQKSDHKEIQKFHSTGATPSGVTAAHCCLLFKVQRRQERALGTELLLPVQNVTGHQQLSTEFSLCVVLCLRKQPL